MAQFIETAVLLVIQHLLVTRVEAGCSLYCAQDKQPVCAHSHEGFKDFKDKCEVEQANHCGGGDWTIIHPKHCTPHEIGGCPLECVPVCGRDPFGKYKTFLNKCWFKIEAELYGYTFSHDGACLPHEIPPSKCEKACTDIYKPVCGYSAYSGYFTFPNECYLKVENECYFGKYILKHTGECNEKEREENCRKKCTTDYHPVCGKSKIKGYKTFDNLCIFYSQRGCSRDDSDYNLVHGGPCTTEEKEKFCLPGFCPTYKKPVCAASLPFYRTFRNKCFFYVANSCKYGDFKIEHDGDCTEEEHKKSCSVKCSEAVIPECAYSDVMGYKTFLNRCFIFKENACKDTDFGVVHIGQCKKDEMELICKLEFCKKYYGKKVCGLSPTKGYTTFENECFLYAENTCKHGDYKVAYERGCTKEELHLICHPEFCLKPAPHVCGYSKESGYFTFPNECFLNAEIICKHKDWILKHKGKCTDHEIGGKCPVICTLDYKPVCAESPTLGWKTFPNKCALTAENNCECGDFKYIHDGECSKKDIEKNCHVRCSFEYLPICAKSPTKGYKTFQNKCLFITDTACHGSDYKFKYAGKCKDHEGPKPPHECHIEGPLCPPGLSPICAYSKTNKAFKTFPTKCHFDADNKCKYDYDLIFAHLGPCSKDEKDNNCHRKCPGDLVPVCGHSHTYGYKTFKNICQLLFGLSCQRSDFTFDHEGKCTSHEAPACESFCHETYSPVCGFSPSEKKFETFPNKCKLDHKNQCDYGDFIVAYKGACPKGVKEHFCQWPCTKEYFPICGYSHKLGYKTFPNICIFLAEIICHGRDYTFHNLGQCKYPEGPQENCPASCSIDDYNPVCAFSHSLSGFITFFNQYFLEADNRCNYGDNVVAHPGKCTKGEIDKKCYRKCPLEYKPICGFDLYRGFQTFPSMCEIEKANKCDGADYSLAHVGKCTHKELGGACKHYCPVWYIGICGHDHVKGFKTFPNECFLDRENSCSLSAYKIVHPGKCKHEETGKECKHFCNLIYSPICAKSASKKTYKSFPNFCHLDQWNSCYNHDYNVEHHGDCFPWEFCVNCKH